MSETYDIPPITRTKVDVITKFEVRVLNITLFTSCSIGVSFFNSDNKFVEYKTFILVGDDYTNWTTDDYIVDYVRKNIDA